MTRFDAPHVQVHECAEPSLKATLTVVVEPHEAGTRLLHRTEYQLMPAFRPLGWLMETLFAHGMMTRNMEQTVENARQMIEAGRGAP